MTNVCSSTDRNSPTQDKSLFWMPRHPAVMNAYPTTLPSSFVAERHHNALTLASLEKDLKTSRTDKPGVPLRQRHLPASFWREPNIPRYPFLPNFQGLVPVNWQYQGQEYKDFIDHLQAAQIQGLNTLGSRFPITEFLYYNYGMKNGVDGSLTHFNDTLWPLGFPQHKKQLTPSTSGSQPGCPYFGCNCSISNPEVKNKGHECHVTGAPPLDLLQSSVWKPIPTKTSSSYPARYHPFAHAR